jgi:isopenicillin N synthase-like dioxygenase
MLSALSTALGLRGYDRFETSHRNGHKSNSTLAMFRYIPGDITSSKEVGHQKHTDIGSLTLLFSEQWGLQVQRPGPENHEKWEFIEPRPGYAVINVGDSLRFASGHQLYSCIHQVVPINTDEHRYSIAYFLRPENEAKYKDSNGKWVTAREWHDAKYEVFQKEHQQQIGSDSILMGGMEMAASAW